MFTISTTASKSIHNFYKWQRGTSHIQTACKQSLLKSRCLGTSSRKRLVRFDTRRQPPNLHALGGHLPEVRLWGNPWKGVLVFDSGFWVPGFCASGTWFQDYRQQDSGFLRMCSGFPKPRIPDSTASAGFRILSSKNFPDSVIWILFHGATLCNVM